MKPIPFPRTDRSLSLLLVALVTLLTFGSALVMRDESGTKADEPTAKARPANAAVSPATADTTVPPASTRFNGSEPTEPQPPTF